MLKTNVIATLSLPMQISASAYIHFLLNLSQLLDLLVDLPHPLDQGQPVLHEVLRGDVLKGKIRHKKKLKVETIPNS